MSQICDEKNDELLIPGLPAISREDALQTVWLINFSVVGMQFLCALTEIARSGVTMTWRSTAAPDWPVR
jgi:hypothetical protein